MYRDAVMAEVAEAKIPAKESKKNKKGDKDTCKESGKCTSSKNVAPVDGLLESSNSKRSKAAAPPMKKVSAGLAGAGGTFSISATLDDK